ncbi:L-amino-acid oxidase [Oryzias latipes]|uniref:L-amino-acid oxidase n=1 Tax=Oryzias latipes TaxID=8090 RepID=UPI0009DB35B7|nr:L-amino-acid oxidase [Oryzias latipes]
MRMASFKLRCLLFTIFLLAFLHLSCNTEVKLKTTLQDCLNDTDYELLHETLDKGLPKTAKTYHVAIVGAGMAGLTTAKLLEDAGYKVTILEASERVGGRVHTYRNEKEGWYVELGAMRIPSTHQILLSLVKKLNLTTNKFIMDDKETFYFVNGKKIKKHLVNNNPCLLNYNIPPPKCNKSAHDILTESLTAVKDIVSTKGCMEALKMFDHYTVKEYFIKEAKLDTETIRMLGDVLNENAIMSLALSEMIYFENDIGDEVDYSEVTGGTDLIPTTLKNTLTKTEVILNAAVKEIDQTSNEVTLKYQLNQEIKSLQADAVLVTTTAKAALLMDLKPPLSTNKVEAMRSIQYGSSTKVVLTFSEKFWERDGIKGGKSVTDRASRFIYYPSHSFHDNNRTGVLLASYTWAEDSQFLLGMNDTQLQDLIMRDLVEIHGDHVRSLLTGMVVKKWSLDSYSLGAFALFGPYQHVQYASELFRSEGRIHFAGEHTAFPHAWIETAMKSAIRAATNIANQAESVPNNDEIRDEL